MNVAIIHDFVKYQIEWLTSHNDLEFEPAIEDAIVQMLKDTGKSFIYEQTAETSQIDHNADSSKMVCVDAISRQAALKKLAVYIHLIDKTMGKGFLTDDDCMEAAKSVLGEDELPAAQPEIIRCKDCKHWRQQTNYQGAPLSFGFCESDNMWRSLYGETTEVSHIDTDDDFYCGYVERRIDDKTNKGSSS